MRLVTSGITSARGVRSARGTRTQKQRQRRRDASIVREAKSLTRREPTPGNFVDTVRNYTVELSIERLDYRLNPGRLLSCQKLFIFLNFSYFCCQIWILVMYGWFSPIHFNPLIKWKYLNFEKKIQIRYFHLIRWFKWIGENHPFICFIFFHIFVAIFEFLSTFREKFSLSNSKF